MNDQPIEDMDEYYDFLPADHPLYNKLQTALEDQLKEEEEKLRMIHKEKREELKKTKRRREDFGVQLYNNQLQYAKLQNANDDNITRLRLLETQRFELQNTLKETEEFYKQKQVDGKIYNRTSDAINAITLEEGKD